MNERYERSYRKADHLMGAGHGEIRTWAPVPPRMSEVDAKHGSGQNTFSTGTKPPVTGGQEMDVRF